MTREQIYEFHDLVQKIANDWREGNSLAKYEPPEIADALRKLLNEVVASERGACAQIADEESATCAAEFVERGRMAANRIAEKIRRRGG